MITRFAPAPTGHLHIGHVVNALYVWNTAQAHQGRVLLRIEDHDRQRSRPEYETSILEDVAWLGFTAAAPAVRQSQRGAIYDTALQRLRDEGLVYACECSRREIAEAGVAGVAGEDLRYPGTCATKDLPDAPGRALRVKLAPSEERFDDMLQGPQVQHPHEQCGDLLLRDRLGCWSYQFAVTVDDMDQAITHVVRGMDLLASTGRQIQLARLLGRDTPSRFLHHPLIMKAPGQKVSKSDGATGIRALRAMGMTPSDVLDLARAKLSSSQ
ncbi:MAG TPA: tRNA glutamyl-Q(34) synthetase GluQRS [Vicinamibacterales bacterium]|nr:tRNA glutamyl-Q(34) synthetase GluQRS [Vicinamibacterales bacterium]